MLRITAKRFEELTADQLAAWEQLQESSATLRSPNFRPEFARLVGHVRDGVRVALFERDGKPVGFLPYEELPNKVAIPLGGTLSDFHGPVVDPEVEWTPAQFLAGCGLSAFDFHHLVADQPEFRKDHWRRLESPVIDLTGGFEEYSAQRRAAKPSQFKRIQRKRRKLEREVGPLRFEMHVADPQVFETLIDWKRQQLVATGVVNVLNDERTISLLRNVLSEQAPAFRGVLSALYAGDELVSIDMSMASHGVLQSWFPAFDRELSNYSPGLVHLFETARHCEAHGFHRIDLGKGIQPYKQFFMNDSVMVAEGSSDLRPVPRWCKRTWYATRVWIRESRLRHCVQKPVRAVRRLSQQMAMS